MPRSDDPNGFPPNRGGRGAPSAYQPRRQGEGADWRYPDPNERYAAQYDDQERRPPRREEPYYEPEPAPSRQARAPYVEDDYRGPAEPPADDPFGWDDPVASAPRDDSLFRRIAGSRDDVGFDDFDMGSDPRRADPHNAHDDYFEPDFGADDYDDPHQPSPPQDMHDRFFSRDAVEEEPPLARDPGSASIYDFDAHRSGARPVDHGYDDPEPWDEYDEAGAAPSAVAPRAHRGAPVDDLDADFFDDEDDDIELAEPPRKKGRTALVAGVLIGAIAVGGGAAYMYKSFENGDLASLEPPTLFADSTPAKGDPSDPGGREFPHGNKQIYDRLSGEPAQPVSETRTSAVSPGIPGIVTTGPEALPDTLEERIEAALRQASRSSETDAAPADTDAPRAVRTLVVRPDGSVEAPPAADPAPATTATAGIVTTTSGPATRSEPEPRREAAPAAERPAQPSATPRPPEQAPAQAAQPSAPAQQERRVASLEPAQSVASSPSTSGANPYFVQIAARRGQTDALAAFADLQQRYPSILAGLTPTIKRADLGDKGVWYRLWVGPLSSKGTADGVCDKLKSAGLKGCFVRTE